jgi:hypothetical protein
MKKSLQFNLSHPSPESRQHLLLFFRLREQEPHLSNKINFPSPQTPNLSIQSERGAKLFHSADGAGIQTNKQANKNHSFRPNNQSVLPPNFLCAVLGNEE